jgi:hypothetical protein
MTGWDDLNGLRLLNIRLKLKPCDGMFTVGSGVAKFLVSTTGPGSGGLFVKSWAGAVAAQANTTATANGQTCWRIVASSAACVAYDLSNLEQSGPEG